MLSTLIPKITEELDQLLIPLLLDASIGDLETEQLRLLFERMAEVRLASMHRPKLGLTVLSEVAKYHGVSVAETTQQLNEDPNALYEVGTWSIECLFEEAHWREYSRYALMLTKDRNDVAVEMVVLPPNTPGLDIEMPESCRVQCERFDATDVIMTWEALRIVLKRMVGEHDARRYSYATLAKLKWATLTLRGQVGLKRDLRVNDIVAQLRELPGLVRITVTK